MDDHYTDGHGQFLTLRSFDRRVTRTIRREHRVTFTFNFETVIRSYLLEDSTQLPDSIGEERLIVAPTTVTIAVGGGTDFDKPDPVMRGMLERVLETSHRLLSDGNREWLLERAIEEARETLRAQKVYSCVNLELGVLLEEFHYYYEGEDRTVPVADSSIQSLKEYEIECGRNVAAESCCSICLEEISGRGEELSGRGRLLCMPCDHVFHGDCIRSWLKISHYCPLCRYEMPIN